MAGIKRAHYLSEGAVKLKDLKADLEWAIRLNATTYADFVRARIEKLEAEAMPRSVCGHYPPAPGDCDWCSEAE